jgi:hypothetical protein
MNKAWLAVYDVHSCLVCVRNYFHANTALSQISGRDSRGAAARHRRVDAAYSSNGRGNAWATNSAGLRRRGGALEMAGAGCGGA